MSNITNDNITIFQLQLITSNIYAFVGLTMFVMGTIGNVCNIVTFLSLRSLLKLASSSLLITSFIGSQFVLSTGVLSRAILGLSGVDLLASSIVWCKIRWLLGPLGGSTALTCIALAFIDRYLITSRHMNRHRWVTRQRAYYMILSAVLIWLIALIPNAIYYTLPLCTIKNTIFAQFSPIFSLVMYSSLPLSVSAVFCILTWINLKSIHMRLIRKNRIDYQVNRMMIAQLCVVLLTSVPNITTQIYTLSSRTMYKSSLRQAQEGLLFAILTSFGSTAHAGSFYVYLIVSRRYRNNVRRIIFCCKNRVTPRRT